MKTNIQVSGGEVVIYGRVEFITAIVQAVAVYEERQNKQAEKQSDEQISVQLAPLRKSKKRRAKKAKRRYKVWNDEELAKLRDYLKAKQLGLLPGQGHVGRLAKSIGRTTQATWNKLSELKKGGVQ